MDNYFVDFTSSGFVEPVTGVKVRAVCLDKVMMTYMEFEPEAVLPEHSHPHEQITVIHEGRLEMTVGGQTKVMGKADVVVVPSNVVRSARTLGEPVIAVDAWSPVREDYR